MIAVTFFREGQSWVGFSAAGHSHFSPRGTDIVCSAVSSLAQTAVLALDQVAGIKPQWQKKEGLLECRLPAGAGSLPESQVIFQTILTGIRHIALEYPDYVKVCIEEV